MAFSYPSALGVHVDRPLTNFAVDFSRDKNTFISNVLFPTMTVDKMSDKYWRFDSLDAFRRTAATDNLWPIGENSEPNTAHFGKDLGTYQCKRYARQHVVPYEFSSNADFAYDQKAVSMLTSLIGIERLIQGFAAATSGLTGTVATETAANLSGGKWDVGVPTTAGSSFLREGILEVVRRIMQNSMNTVDPRNLWCCISPTTAKLWAISLEVIDFVKQSPSAIAAMTNGSEFSNGPWFGLPRVLFGVNIMVISPVYVTTEEGGADTKSYLVNDSAIFLNVESPGLMTYNTITGFEYEPMNIRTYDLGWKAQRNIQCVTNMDYVCTALNSGFYVTDTDT